MRVCVCVCIDPLTASKKREGNNTKSCYCCYWIVTFFRLLCLDFSFLGALLLHFFIILSLLLLSFILFFFFFLRALLFVEWIEKEIQLHDDCHICTHFSSVTQFPPIFFFSFFLPTFKAKRFFFFFF